MKRNILDGKKLIKNFKAICEEAGEMFNKHPSEINQAQYAICNNSRVVYAHLNALGGFSAMKKYVYGSSKPTDVKRLTDVFKKISSLSE